ncbi:MAG: YkgJ family cysteine cluster protein [Deltaproteobacteria bacterium]|nr:YkgJ family cysteine cluster protein [Deltaproteobacteria bacterium]
MDESTRKTSTKDPLRMDADHVFQFRCGPGVPCFTQCCQDITIVLSPYDVVRLKNGLGITSEELIDRYTLIIRRENLLIPMVVLKMNDDDKRCPFVTEKGCRVYNDRPWPCRMYPLDMNDDGTFGIIADSSRCKGLYEDEHARISNWLVEQGVPVYDEMNQLFSQVTAPLKAQDLDIDNPQIYQMTFMALYNLDKFRNFVFKSTFLDRFDVDDVTLEKIKRSDVELLKFAFDWIKFGIFGQKVFSIKESALPKEKDPGR